MVEATVICLDNSEWARNGDYSPNRWEAQQEAASIIAGNKTQNPGNSVGVVAMAGPRVDVLVAPTNDIAKIFAAMHSTSIKGKSDLYSALQTAQLALKHRSNKEQRQRVIGFVCSPVEVETEKLVTLGRNLKKNNISLDLVVFGNLDNIEKLQELHKNVNSGDNSHLVSIPSGIGILSENLANTPIMHGGSGQPANFSEYGGIDPNADPEYAAAIRLSLEEHKKRQDDQNREGGQNQPMEGISEMQEEDEEERLLQEAIKLSMMDIEQEPPKEEAKQEPPKQEDPDVSAFRNQEFVSDILSSLPGVDMQDPAIQEALKSLQGKDEEKKKEEENKKEENQ
ncbi:unnamed protein product [Blepharisma stoltei]|uniref:VWFA domain-containing protein n=1 Tax=Blepharisma stoltei TaxID=1481888 RepID=A0AAU9J390_9CILI|nr:unnamed protein product [Blepharisma stoltei]